MSKNFFSVGIIFYGDNIVIPDVTRMMGVEPTKSRECGEVRYTHSGAKVVQKTGFWEFRARVDVSEIERYLTEVLKGVDLKIYGHAGVTKAELDIYFPLDLECESGFSFEISNRIIKNLYDVGLDLIITAK